jgi:RES domain
VVDFSEYHDRAIARYHDISEQCGLKLAPSVLHPDNREVFFRGRIADTVNLTPRENRFSYPPQQYCTGYGRANIPYHPVFYAAQCAEVIANELRLDFNSWLHVAVFYTPRPVNIRRLLLVHDGFIAEGHWAKCRDSAKDDIIRNTDPAAFTRQQIEDSWEQLERTALQFRTPNYEDTSAISHFWLYQAGLDGIVYPSLRNDDFCNFALHPAFVDNHLMLHCVHACYWKSEGLELHHIGYPASGNTLIWKKSTTADAAQWSDGYPALKSASVDSATAQ